MITLSAMTLSPSPSSGVQVNRQVSAGVERRLRRAHRCHGDDVVAPRATSLVE